VKTPTTVDWSRALHVMSWLEITPTERSWSGCASRSRTVLMVISVLLVKVSGAISNWSVAVLCWVAWRRARVLGEALVREKMARADATMVAFILVWVIDNAIWIL